jgi:tRNA(Ile)-lysidine synthase
MDGPTSSLIADLLSRCTFPAAGTHVSCAVSGGADSLALLFLAHAHGLDIQAIHVDHGLRAESSTDVNVITPIAQQLGIQLLVHTIAVEDGPNLEARARDARYALMPHDVMTGHTQDDQAETLLINLLRGAASQGLGAMRPGFTRPLLSVRRSETHAVCEAMGVTPVNDSTNTDPRFQRNRVRAELLPLMANLSRRDPAPLLARTADVLRADNDLLDSLASNIDPTDALALASAPLPLARRAIRLWLANPYPPDLATIERVLSVARGDVLACDIGENREIRRSKQRLSIQNLR